MQEICKDIKSSKYAVHQIVVEIVYLYYTGCPIESTQLCTGVVQRQNQVYEQIMFSLIKTLQLRCSYFIFENRAKIDRVIRARRQKCARP